MARVQIPAGARKRPGGGYEWRFTVDGVRASVGAPTIEELKIKQKEREAEIKAGIYKANKKITVSEYFHEWLERRRPHIRGSTICNYKVIFTKHIEPYIGSVNMKNVERRQVLAIQEKANKNAGITAANHALVLLKTLFKAAMEDEILIRNVADGVKKITDKTKRPARETIHRELSDEELKIIFKYSSTSYCDSLFHFMLYTGMRVGEVGGLEWRDIDWKNDVIHVRRTMTRKENGHFTLGATTKTRAGNRAIGMNTNIRAILSKQWELYTGTHGKMIKINDPVFPSPNGKRVTEEKTASVVKNIVNQANRHGETLANFGTHAFRDTFASRAIRAGMPPNTLKEILGHSSLAMTMDLYAHVSQEDKKKAMQALDAINL
ncbi:tyrosine-type recombinase/integrase [Dialister sp.]|jgi:integrase|uniref:tyrosine-type recombinase/integrase n=1 Tax=Dialister sp. TaxID=1955814 RepID=UPI003A5C0FEA